MKKSDKQIFKDGTISVHGARVHNLKNASVNIPKNKLVVFTGVSGSGKSSLAFDTIYAEGQRRYVESLSAYARQFLGMMDKPDVERIDGLSPAIAIDQKSVSKNPRSTVGTITEIHDYLRLLFARVGHPHCPKCGRPVVKQTPSQIVDQILALDTKSEILILGPVIRQKKGEHHGTLEEIDKGGFVRVRVDGIVYRTEEALDKQLDKQKKHSIEVVVDRIINDKKISQTDRMRLADSVETSLKLGEGTMIVSADGKDEIFSERFACQYCHINLPNIEPRLFSFNNPIGACPHCQGLGTKMEIEVDLVIPSKELSINEGAIRPWSRMAGGDGWTMNILSGMAKSHKIDLDKPVEKLNAKDLKKILYGTGEEIYKIEFSNGESYKTSYEGVVPNLERRWKETESDFMRSEIERYMTEKECPVCLGKRLKPEVLAITIDGKSIADICALSISNCKTFFSDIKKGDIKQTQNESTIIAPLEKEIQNRLNFLINVGLKYLTLERKAGSLSGGEAQRIRLATQIGSGLSGVVYILDEPSIGLHERDVDRLIATLRHLQKLGNTVIVVEHDEQTIMSSDWVIDIGPGAGHAGGKVMFFGSPEQLKNADNLTGKYLSGKLIVTLPSHNKISEKSFIEIKGAKEHNLKNIDVKIPLGNFVAVSGVSGSGKSSLVNDILAKSLMRHFYNSKEEPGKHEKIEGLENIDKVVVVDQSPIGRTPRSNPATYTGLFTPIRDLFASTHEAKIRGYNPGRFSFNVKGGRCEVCQGDGYRKIEMYFLPDIYVQCEECHGARYNKEALEIEYKGKNISQILKMNVEDALEFFKHIPSISQKLKTLKQVGLGYMEIGQPATTLSGGEAQRIKLATELARKSTGQTLYILDEPTTGLHFDDVRKLLIVLRELTDKGNTILVIEHNPDVLRSADWIIDLGPEGGENGGEIVAQGTPDEIKKDKKSYTGRYL